MPWKLKMGQSYYVSCQGKLRYIMPPVKTVKSWRIRRYAVWCKIWKYFYRRNDMTSAKSFIKGQLSNWLRRALSKTTISIKAISIRWGKNADTTIILRAAKNCWKQLKIADMININNSFFCRHTFSWIQVVKTWFKIQLPF